MERIDILVLALTITFSIRLVTIQRGTQAAENCLYGKCRNSDGL